MQSDLVNTIVAAAFLELKPETLESWRYRGGVDLPFVRLGRKAIRYRRSDLEAFIKKGLHRNTSEGK